MPLTFRSTIAEYVQIIVRDSDGSKRVATVERDLDNVRKWVGSVDHPSGQKYPVDAFGYDSTDAIGKLAQAFVSLENDYHQSKKRNHRPQSKQAFDHSIAVPDDGPIVPYTSFNKR